MKDFASTSITMIAIIAIVFFCPFLLLCGANFILDTMNLPNIPYNFSSLFGALLVVIAIGR